MVFLKSRQPFRAKGTKFYVIHDRPRVWPKKSNFDPKSQSLTKKSNVDQNDQKCDRVILRSQ